MKTKEEELKEELNRIKGLVQNVEGKIEELKLSKEDKFAKLKEAHKNGSVIQYRVPKAKWIDCDNEDPPLWLDYLEYRIKPEEKPKIGDVCKVWDDDEAEFVVCILSTPVEQWYKNAKKLSKQEAIELLFGSED